MSLPTSRRRGLLVLGILLAMGGIYALLHTLTGSATADVAAGGIATGILAYLVFFVVILGGGFLVFKGIFSAERKRDGRREGISLSDIPRDQDDVKGIR